MAKQIRVRKAAKKATKEEASVTVRCWEKDRRRATNAATVATGSAANP